MGGPVVLAGVAEQAPAGGRQPDGVDVVLQDAVLHVGEGVLAQRLLKEEAHQRGLERLIAQLAQGLEDPGDPQVVVVGFIKVLEALLPVGSPSHVPALIQQFDAVEIQHEGIRRQESPLGFPGVLEFFDLLLSQFVCVEVEPLFS